MGSYLKTQSDTVKIVGLQPKEKSQIPGIRRWSPAYLPGIFRKELVDSVIDMSQTEAEQTMRPISE